MKSHSQIKIGALISYLVIFTNIAVGLLFTPWVIRTIGKPDYGLYTLAMSVISLFVFDFGLSSAITRYIAKYVSEGNQEKANQFVGISTKLYLVVDLFIGIILIFLYFNLERIYVGLSPSELVKFKTVFVFAAFFCAFSLPFIPLTGILNAYEKFIQLKLCELIHKLLLVIFTLVALLQNGGLNALVFSNIAAGVLLIVSKIFVVKTTTPIRVNVKYYDHGLLMSIIGFCSWVTVTALCQRCIFNVSPSILGIVSDSDNIAILGVAISLEGFAYTFANAINGMFLPEVSRMVNRGQENAILPLMIKVGRLQIMIIGLIVLGFVLVGKDFIILWVGESYLNVYSCALLLIIPSFFYLPQEIGTTTILVKNKVKYRAYVYILMAFINIILAFPLGAKYGALGICASVFIAYMARLVGINVIYSRVLYLDLWQFYKESFFRLFPSLAIAFICSFCIIRLMGGISWFFLICKVSIIIIVYVMVLLILGMNTSEKQLLRSFFHI